MMKKTRPTNNIRSIIKPFADEGAPLAYFQATIQIYDMVTRKLIMDKGDICGLVCVRDNFCIMRVKESGKEFPIPRQLTDSVFKFYSKVL